jgi:DNA-binding NtrC family response regulator
VAAAPAVTDVVRALRIMRGESASTLLLDETARYVIGRHDAADIVFDAPDVSRLHGVVRFVDGHWAYEDYGSQNGTTVVRADDIKVLSAHAPESLRAFDVLELGGEAARIEMLPAGESAAHDDDSSPFEVEVSKAARLFAERVRLAGKTRVPVFLLGPSGVGKTFTARVIHERSALPGPLVSINCARLPQEPVALHSELLGHVRGAYTGAEGARTGKLIHADGGTLFLDEIESLPALAQGFLLDVLESSGDLAPLGAAPGAKLKPITFRTIAASKAPLSQSGLRADLCERLAEGHLWRVPSLDERRDDIPGLLRRFAAEQEKMLGARVIIAPAAVRYCADARWPGQIRQLRASVVALAQLGLARRDVDDSGPITLREADFAAHIAERELAFGDEGVRIKADARALTAAQVRQAVAAAGGSKAAAAKALGISRNTLAKKVRSL